MKIEIPKDIQDSKDYFSSAVSAIGVQIYVCKPKEGALNQFEWSFKAPEAELFDGDGRLIGRHFNDEVNGGPAWELNDGSKVVGNKDKAQKHIVENSIPWLRLPTKVTKGNGRLSQINSIQRLLTLGGKPPAQAPDKSQEDKELRVYYSATYYFNR